MPQLGLGTWQIEDQDEVEAVVTTALEAGYRMIDTAAIYGNEEGVGRAIINSKLPRDQLFVTTKLWNKDQGHDSALAAYDTSLKKLGLDYVDLYLIHWPMPKTNTFVETWKALEELYANERVRAIGVANFKPKHLQTLIDASEVMPAVNQIELHPRLTQLDTREYCLEKGVKVESYSPLMQAGEIMSNQQLQTIAEHHHKTVAQVILHWHIQSQLIVIPKSSHASRIKENIDIFDFNLSADQMQTIDALNQDNRIIADPDEFNL